ncbi:hypothetical protein L226DRAFT_531838 [Lentinus tigrinus ALCF2SS1-7]|uniref:uncharacterized protein n=1 Tax=Lentinus tigrinus ALCF2SS1-7 TaxID=1328758 RepID=UPI001166322E|nr:hypothetical protein L226DRAFT_531838 [Lentinus tigrinus ALCF2SS1-7]
MPLGDHLSVLHVCGHFVTVGLLNSDDPLPTLHASKFAGTLGRGRRCSHIGNKQECLEMLELAHPKGIKP